MLLNWSPYGTIKLTRDLSKYHSLYTKVNGKSVQQIVYLQAPSEKEIRDMHLFRQIALAAWGRESYVGHDR